MSQPEKHQKSVHVTSVILKKIKQHTEKETVRGQNFGYNSHFVKKPFHELPFASYCHPEYLLIFSTVDVVVASPPEWLKETSHL